MVGKDLIYTKIKPQDMAFQTFVYLKCTHLSVCSRLGVFLIVMVNSEMMYIN